MHVRGFAGAAFVGVVVPALGIVVGVGAIAGRLLSAGVFGSGPGAGTSCTDGGGADPVVAVSTVVSGPAVVGWSDVRPPDEQPAKRPAATTPTTKSRSRLNPRTLSP